VSEDRFYHAGCEARGIKGPLVPIRRALRRILRPIFIRLAEQVEDTSSRIDQVERRLDGLDGRLDLTADQLRTTIAFGWDYVAMVRRLAALEDEVVRLRGDASSRFAEGQLTLPFPEQVTAPRAQAS
jgi:hypothetical protein